MLCRQMYNESTQIDIHVSLYAGTQSAWLQILNFPIIDSNVRLETVGLEKSTSKIIRIPTTDAASKAGHRLEMPDWYWKI